MNSTWTKGHVDRLLRPFGWRDDAPDAEPTIEVGGNSSATTSGIDPVTASNLRSREKKELPMLANEASGSSPRRFKVATIVYPPCDTLSLSSLPLEFRERVILSVAQFRFVSLCPLFADRMRTDIPVLPDRRKSIQSNCMRSNACSIWNPNTRMERRASN